MWLGTAALAHFAIQFLKGMGTLMPKLMHLKKNTT